MELDTSPSLSSVRMTKRKLEDAIRTLDGAVVSSSSAVAVETLPTPLKRPHRTRSVYSTSAKFGAMSKERFRPSSNSTPTVNVSKSMPHLAAILARSASQSKQAPFDHLSMHVHPVSEYRPSSVDSLLSRLATYKITTYANKPPQIDAVAAARCGWINDGKDRLVCGICDASWVLAGRDGMSKDAASALVEKQRTSLVEMHKDGCPWKARQCEPSVYRVPLQAPTAMVRELRATALSLGPIVADVAIKHPLSPSQLNSLRSIFAAESESWLQRRDTAIEVNQDSHSVVPSDTAIVVALFGWGPAPASMRSELHRTSLSTSRAGSYCPSASRPPSPQCSRASSISGYFRERATTPTLSASPRISTAQLGTSSDHIGASLRMRNLRSNCATTISASPDASVVYCALCQRRVGLWGFSRNETIIPSMHNGDLASTPHTHDKGFDLVKEHRTYCPYVVCSAVVPSFSHSPVVDSYGHVTEGWRAVLTIVQRYELSQRQRLSRFLSNDDLHSQASSAELKGVEAMVASVKTNGGRELLRYVKDLLG